MCLGNEQFYPFPSPALDTHSIVHVQEKQPWRICINVSYESTPRPLSTKWTNVLPNVLSHGVSKTQYSYLEFSNRSDIDRHFDSSAAEMPVNSQSDTIIITCSLKDSRLHENLR